LYKRQAYLRALLSFSYTPSVRLSAEENQLHHRLLKVANAFVVHLDLQMNPVVFQERLALAQLQRGCDKNYRASINKLESLLKASNNRDHNYHRYEMSLYRLKEAVRRDEHREIEGFLKLNQAIEAHFIENKLLLAMEVANRKYTLSEEDFAEMIPLPLEMIEQNFEAFSIRCKILYHLYMMHQSKASSHFWEAERLFFQSEYKLDINFQQTILVQLRNFCVRQMNLGELDWGEKYIRFIEFMDKKKLLLEKQEIVPTLFQLIVRVALRVNKMTWAMDFVNKYQTKLPAGSKNEIVNLTKANILFHQKSYRKALRSLSSIQRKEHTYRIATDRLKMKLLLELEIYDVLHSTSQNFMRYVRTSKKVPEANKGKLLTFAKKLNQLAKYKNRNPHKISKLREGIIQDAAAGNKLLDEDWFLEKMQ